MHIKRDWVHAYVGRDVRYGDGWRLCIGFRPRLEAWDKRYPDDGYYRYGWRLDVSFELPRIRRGRFGVKCGRD